VRLSTAHLRLLQVHNIIRYIVTAGLHPHSSRYFAWQPVARVLENLGFTFYRYDFLAVCIDVDLTIE